MWKYPAEDIPAGYKKWMNYDVKNLDNMVNPNIDHYYSVKYILKIYLGRKLVLEECNQVMGRERDSVQWTSFILIIHVTILIMVNKLRNIKCFHLSDNEFMLLQTELTSRIKNCLGSMQPISPSISWHSEQQKESIQPHAFWWSKSPAVKDFLPTQSMFISKVGEWCLIVSAVS